jgi:HIRAN domain
MNHALLVAWRSGSPERGGWGPVGRLDYHDTVYRFVYTKGARSLAGFQPFPEMEDLEEIYESTELFPMFANRLLPATRPEYDAYLRWGGFDPSNPPDPISILGVTEGMRQTDSIEVFPCPTPDNDGCYVNKFFVHGLRYMAPAAHEKVNQLTPGQKLFLMADLSNPSDQQAVALRTETERLLLGYVPRYLARDVWKLLVECDLSTITVCVERVNCDAPLQQRLLCRMCACWPEEFSPCNDEAFFPIPSQVSVNCPA